MIYLIVKVNYDTLENHDNIKYEIVGYCEDEESAIRHIKKLKNETTTFIPRYEHTAYPYFEYKEISKLQ